MRFESQTVTGQQRHGDSEFPLVLVAEEVLSTQDLLAQPAALMEQLATHGAILFRGFGVTDAQAFDDFADWYTDGGYAMAPWLELLDLRKWALGGQ